MAYFDFEYLYRRFLRMERRLRSVETTSGTVASTAFTALTGTAWDGTNKYTTLTANTALTLSVGTNTSGILHVLQDAIGSRTLTINGVSFAINSAASSITGIGYYVANGKINFTMDKTLVSYVPDVTAPTVVSITAADLHTIQVVNSEAVGGTVAGWSFKRNGASVLPTGVSGTTTRSFTFAETFLNTDTFLVSYDATTGDTVDVAGNEIASFAEGTKTVTNSITSNTFATTNRVALYKKNSMVRSGGKVTTWTNTDGDTTKNFVSAYASSTVAEPIDATTNGLQMSTGENLKQASEMVIAGPITYYALIKTTADGAILSGPNTNGYGFVIASTSLWFSPGTNAEGYQTVNTGIAAMATFKVVTLVWTPGSSAKVYLDGTLVGTLTGTISGTNLRIDWLGGASAGNISKCYLKGIAIFNAAHDAATVATQSPLFQTEVDV